MGVATTKSRGQCMLSSRRLPITLSPGPINGDSGKSDAAAIKGRRQRCPTGGEHGVPGWKRKAGLFLPVFT